MKSAEYHIVEDSPGYNSWPMIACKDGRLICIYSCGTAHNIWEPCRKVMSRTSDDGGIRWNAPVEVVNTLECGDVPAGKGIDNTGAALFWVRVTGTNTFRHELYRTQDGIAFEKIAVFSGNPVPMQITDIFSVPGAGLMSLWFAGVYRNDAGNNSWGILTSSDNGLSWKQQTIESGLNRVEWPTEPSAVYLGNGRILAVARTESRETLKHQYQLQSEDFGQTWTRRATNINDVAESTPSLIFEEKSQTLCCYYYQRGAGLLKRRLVSIEQIWNHPENWSEPEIIAHGSTENEHAGNVNVCCRNGRHIAAFYTGSQQYTKIVTLTL